MTSSAWELAGRCSTHGKWWVIALYQFFCFPSFFFTSSLLVKQCVLWPQVFLLFLFFSSSHVSLGLGGHGWKWASGFVALSCLQGLTHNTWISWSTCQDISEPIRRNMPEFNWNETRLHYLCSFCISLWLSLLLIATIWLQLPWAVAHPVQN